MNEPQCSRKVVINNPQGLHARPADLFTRTANRYEARIIVVKDNNRVDGKSILDLLTLAAEAGTELTIEAAGRDADEALEALAGLIVANFEDESTRPAPPH
ncbi:MAG: HPr family phosphocarrier protein [Pirellulales bacterium]|nr:HPr family phosphocarrier protein [Pirellulales bacterium]